MFPDTSDEIYFSKVNNGKTTKMCEFCSKLTIKTRVTRQWSVTSVCYNLSRANFRVNLHSIVCLNVNELLAQSRCHIWSLSDSNEIRTHNHLVRKPTFNHLAKLAKWLNGWVFFYELFGCGFQYRCWSVTPLKIFQKAFWCFYCWLWTSKFRLGLLSCRSKISLHTIFI